MLAWLPIGCADNRDYTERKKDRAKNISISRQARLRRTATGSRAKQGRASWRPFLPPIRTGQRLGATPLARVDSLEPQCKCHPPRQNGRPSFWERPSHALPDRKGFCRESNPSRPRPVGGVIELVKYATLTVLTAAQRESQHDE